MEVRGACDGDVLAQLRDELLPLGLELLDRLDALGVHGLQHLSANAWNSSFFETGSVSQPTATSVPDLPSPASA